MTNEDQNSNISFIDIVGAMLCFAVCLFGLTFIIDTIIKILYVK